VTQHLSSGELEEYLLNRVGPDAQARIEEHLLVCEECQEAALAAETDLAALQIALRRAENRSHIDLSASNRPTRTRLDRRMILDLVLPI
jgi:hypothetical protein